MVKKDKKNLIDGINVPEASFSDLLGKQSVRATFRLSERAIESISIVAGHLGIKQKSLFDHLIEDKNALNTIAEKLASIKSPEFQRVQKTFVLSRRTLNSLEIISKTFGTPRDALVEYSIQRLEAIIDTERKKHKIRKKIISELEEHVRKTEVLLRKTRDLLGDDDPVCLSLELLLSTGINSYNEVEKIIEKGQLIENL